MSAVELGARQDSAGKAKRFGSMSPGGVPDAAHAMARKSPASATGGEATSCWGVLQRVVRDCAVEGRLLIVRK